MNFLRSFDKKWWKHFLATMSSSMKVPCTCLGLWMEVDAQQDDVFQIIFRVSFRLPRSYAINPKKSKCIQMYPISSVSPIFGQIGKDQPQPGHHPGDAISLHSRDAAWCKMDGLCSVRKLDKVERGWELTELKDKHFSYHRFGLVFWAWVPGPQCHPWSVPLAALGRALNQTQKRFRATRRAGAQVKL